MEMDTGRRKSQAHEDFPARGSTAPDAEGRGGQRRRFLALSAAGATTLLLPGMLRAQHGAGDVVYVPTPQVVVNRMMSMAKVSPADFVIDLGSGDGRQLITAVGKFGARGGRGYDLDEELLRQAVENAKKANVADRVAFIRGNMFETDVSALPPAGTQSQAATEAACRTAPRLAHRVP